MAELPHFSNLTLVLTEQCNLRCAYCYVPKTGRVMSEALALRAASFLVDRAREDQDLTLSFFGGEPFLARPLMERVMMQARGRAGSRMHFSAPTNGTLLDDGGLALVRESGMQLALSLDGAAASADRLDVAGAGSLSRLRPLLPRVRELKPILRMTVTPENVDHLCDNVTTLYSWGFERIMHQPALEEEWPAEAVETWCSEHRRLVDWLCDRRAAREPIPDLVTLEGISMRLSGRSQSHCGAGVSQAAVSIDGRLFGCYRSVYDPRAAERLVLGHLDGGAVNETLLATYARLHPSRALPERGSCKSCEAQAGCTCYCPAMGHILLGDLRGVSERACRLMRPQVGIVAEAMERMAASDRSRRRNVVSHVAAAALALSLTTGAAACGGRPTGPVADGHVEQIGPGLCAPGVCMARFDGPVGGVCPVQIPDLGLKKDTARKPDAPAAGLCPPPGLCPYVKPDLGAAKRDSVLVGLCPPPGLC